MPEDHQAGWLLHHEPPSQATPWTRDFDDLGYEWRRLFSEVFGTFLLVVVAAGARWSTRQVRGKFPLPPRSSLQV